MWTDKLPVDGEVHAQALTGKGSEPGNANPEQHIAREIDVRWLCERCRLPELDLGSLVGGVVSGLSVGVEPGWG